MTLKKIIVSYLQYNGWANEQIIQWLKTLERDLLYKETPSSFNSIDLTLQHMNNAQNFWHAVVTKADITLLDETVRINAADSVMNDLLAGSQRMIDLCTAYTEDDLLEQVSTKDATRQRHEFILHMVNHNSYHRGQIVTMCHCLGTGGNISPTDYDVFLWQTTD